MPVFDGKITTPTRAHSAANDSKGPSFRSLDPHAMTSPTALAGTVGVDCSLIHGDSDFLLNGNLKLHVTENMTELVDGSHLNTVTQNKIASVLGTTSQTFYGNHEQTNIAPRTDTFVHTRTEMHSQPEQVHQPTETNESTESQNEEKYKVFEYKKHFIEMGDANIELSTLLSADIKNRDMTLAFVSAEGQAYKHEIHGIRNNIGAMCTDLHGVKVKAAVTHAKAIAANINAGFAANADSPLG